MSCSGLQFLTDVPGHNFADIAPARSWRPLWRESSAISKASVVAKAAAQAGVLGATKDKKLADSCDQLGQDSA